MFLFFDRQFLLFYGSLFVCLTVAVVSPSGAGSSADMLEIPCKGRCYVYLAKLRTIRSLNRPTTSVAGDQRLRPRVGQHERSKLLVFMLQVFDKCSFCALWTGWVLRGRIA